MLSQNLNFVNKNPRFSFYVCYAQTPPRAGKGGREGLILPRGVLAYVGGNIKTKSRQKKKRICKKQILNLKKVKR